MILRFERFRHYTLREGQIIIESWAASLQHDQVARVTRTQAASTGGVDVCLRPALRRPLTFLIMRESLSLTRAELC